MHETEEQQAAIEVRAFEGGALLRLAGVVDILAARQLHGEALLLAAAGGAVVVDCSRCERLDASALQILLALDAHFRERQATLRIVGGSPAVRAWLRVAGCASLLPAAHAGSPTDERTGGEIESAQNSAYRG